MHLVSDVRDGAGSAVRYYRRDNSGYLYWERWLWRVPPVPAQRSIVVGWSTPVGLIVGLASYLASRQRPITGEATWVHVESGWCAPHLAVQS